MKRGAGDDRTGTNDEDGSRWRAAARGAHRAWIAEMDRKGLDGKQMFADLLALVKKYGK